MILYQKWAIDRTRFNKLARGVSQRNFIRAIEYCKSAGAGL
ncbi:hypothetical protein [Microcoleus vaginatus]